MKKKIFSTAILLIVLLITTNIFAATVSSQKAVMEIVENNVCTIKITDKAVFEKKITDYDLDKKELTIGLKVTNNAILPLDKPSEVVLVIDNSESMIRNSISSGETRMVAVADSAKLLATELLKLDTVKISVVSFSTVDNGDKNYADEGYIAEGTLADAKLRTALTNSQEAVLDAIDEVENDATGVRTDIEAGLTLGSQQFTGTCENQFMILLSDGVPNISLGSNAIMYSGQTATNTKNALLKTAQDNIQLLSMMTGLTEDLVTLADGTQKSYKQLAEEIFGTPEDPTVGSYYYVTDDQIEETISKNILGELIAPKTELLTDIDIYDYFPQEIVDNFDFEYVQEPTNGEISEDIDLQNNMIVWHIDSLGYQESATVSYKLTLKDNIDESIIGVVLKTNEKVDITTEKVLDDDGEKKVITSDVTPKIKVTLEKDPTVAPDPVPQTGATIAIYVIIAVAVIACIVIGIRLYIKGKDIK